MHSGKESRQAQVPGKCDGRLERCAGFSDAGPAEPGQRGDLSAECVRVSVVGCFVGVLLRTMSIERYLDPNLTSVMVLSKGRSKPDSNKRLKGVKMGGGRETTTLTRDGDDVA